MATEQLRAKSDFSHDGPKCPFCGYVQTPDESFYFNQAGYELDCIECGGYFYVTPEVTTTWYTKAKTWEG